MNNSAQTSEEDSTDVDRFYPISTKTLLDVFYLSVLGWTVWLLRRAGEWGFDDRLFPYLVGVPLCILVVVKLLKLHFEGVLPFPSINIEDGGPIVPDDDRTTRPRNERQRYELIMLAWVVALPVVLYYFGFVLVVPVYLFAFLWYFKRDLKLALVTSVGGSVALYGLFVILLDVPIWEGALDLITVLLP